jgi:hypothetical protein
VWDEQPGLGRQEIRRGHTYVALKDPRSISRLHGKSVGHAFAIMTILGTRDPHHLEIRDHPVRDAQISAMPHAAGLFAPTRRGVGREHGYCSTLRAQAREHSTRLADEAERRSGRQRSGHSTRRRWTGARRRKASLHIGGTEQISTKAILWPDWLEPFGLHETIKALCLEWRATEFLASAALCNGGAFLCLSSKAGTKKGDLCLLSDR